MNSKAIELKCPKCDIPIPAYKVNVTANVAECTVCDSRFEVSELLKSISPIGRTDRSIELPRDSKVQLTEGPDSIDIYMPRAGFRSGHLFVVPFALFWSAMYIGGITFGLGNDGIFMLFLIAFSVGFIMLWYNLLNGLTHTERIHLSNDGILLHSKAIFRSKKRHYTWRDISGISLVELVNYNNNGGRGVSIAVFENVDLMFKFGQKILIPGIVSGKGTGYFFQLATDDEKEWVVSYLNDQVEQINR